MKKVLFTAVICIIAFSSCKSREEKAECLIREDLSKVLYDFDSYQPVETDVIPAKHTANNDSTLWHKAGVLSYGMDQISQYVKDATTATEHMNIWGRPTSYSSSYSDNQYYKYKDQRDEAVNNANKSILLCKTLAEELKDLIGKLDTTEIIGWEVQHTFRCKTYGGYSDLVHYRYVLSKNFKNVIIREKKDEEGEKVQIAIETAKENLLDDIHLIEL